MRYTTIVCCVLLAGCTPEAPVEGEPGMTLSEDEIRRLATAELLRLDWSPEEFRAVVTASADGWRVEFEPIEPSPPGRDLMVQLDSAGVVTRVFQGE